METHIKSLVVNIQKNIFDYLSRGKNVFATSSFQSHSLPLLHIISTIDKSIPVYFINTGFHFSETLKYREDISLKLNLNLIDLNPLIPKNLQKNNSGYFYFNSDPDYCCFINKIQPVEAILPKYDIWISGVRAEQSINRKYLHEEERMPTGQVKYHPMLGWNSKMIFYYISKHNLPRHPLESKGYYSIGCEPCTRKSIADTDRGGRWFGLTKTECGLNTGFINKNKD